MTNHPTSSGTVNVELSQFEAAELFEFLGARSDECCGRCEDAAIEPLLERLDDANAIAQWLRCRVRLDLALQEAIQLGALLSAKLLTVSDVSPQCRAAILSVRDKLARVSSSPPSAAPVLDELTDCLPGFEHPPSRR